MVLCRRQPGFSVGALPRRRVICYALWALCDVEANYLVVRAFQYTSLTSVTLLDMFTIPCALLLTRLALGARYARRHVAGVLLCLAGLVGLVLSDAGGTGGADEAGSGSGSGGSGKPEHSGKEGVVGDVLALCGAALMAVSNVSQELIVRGESETGGRAETLAALGGFGALWSLVQVLALERAQAAALWGAAAGGGREGLRNVGLIVLFAAALFVFYTLAPHVIGQNGSAFFNLSLLTSDVWAVVVQATVFGRLVGPGYAGAAVAVVAGLLLYTSAGEPKTGGVGISRDFIRLIEAGDLGEANVEGNVSSGEVSEADSLLPPHDGLRDCDAPELSGISVAVGSKD